MSVPYTVCEQLSVILSKLIDGSSFVSQVSFFFIPYLGYAVGDCIAAGDLT